jgi:hypothetical protein
MASSNETTKMTPQTMISAPTTKYTMVITTTTTTTMYRTANTTAATTLTTPTKKVRAPPFSAWDEKIQL